MIYHVRNSTLLLLALFCLGITSIAQRPYRLNERQMNNLLQRIENRSQVFQQSLDAALDRSRFDSTRRENEINRYVRDFTEATSRLRNRSRVNNDVTEVLNRASYLNDFMQRERLDTRAQNDWLALRRELDQLANAWNLNWNWNNQGATSSGTYPQGNSRYAANRLTGTWRLNLSRSDDPRTIAERATQNERNNERNDDRTGNRSTVQDNLMRRLEAPDALAIERRGQTVTMASNRAQQISFEANGRESTETLKNGRQRSTRATLTGERLMVRTTGDRGNDYEVIFEPIEGGRSLRVIRSLFTDRLNQTIVSRSIYDRTAETAQFTVYNGATDYPDTRSNTRRGNFLMTDGTQVIATLNNDLRTKEAQEGDTFSMTIQQPNQFAGAVIEGRILNAERSGRISGRAGFQLEFDRIRTRDGRTAEFAGTIETVRLPNGETVRVDQEGSVEEDKSQTNRTIQRSTIGGAIGAIIGAIAGGGKGAAIGAVVGAGAGAGSIYVQGRDDLELTRGTELTIRASAPR